MSGDAGAMDSTIFYSLNSSRLGTAAIINNLHSEQVDLTPNKAKNKARTKNENMSLNVFENLTFHHKISV